ncbi:MAG TPA: T9SS type A sorting domain-containing protein [Edaphocola sp.]|nr:T9SS type A sorting domain-containing protein [Edaphocola sp.]
MRKTIIVPILTLLCTIFLFNFSTNAQTNVASLSYQSPIVALANQTIINLAPSLSGNATSYSITPSLPAGLSFNTNTGLISGIGTSASPLTTYTITAFGINSTQFFLDLEVTNNYFNNTFGTLSFGGPGVTVIRGDNGDPITNTTTNTHGRAVNDVVVYKNVVTLGGTSIDCIVKTISSNVTSWTAYDQDAQSGSSFSSNEPHFFSPQVVFPNSNGHLSFNFQFILGGTYDKTTQKGKNVILLGAQINSYDIDGNGSSNSEQSTEFSGFSSYTLNTTNTFSQPVVNSLGLTVFKSNTTTNTANVTDSRTRVRVNYTEIGNFTATFGGGGTAYFFLDFGSGPTFTTPIETPSPLIDLNNSTPGVNNNNAGCGVQLKFTPSITENNVTYAPTTADLTQFSVSFPTNEILNGADEELWINGTTTGIRKIPLNANFSTGHTFTLGSINYNSVVATNSGGVRTIVFKASTNITRTEAEALLDAMSYNNKADNATAGAREFTVNVFTTAAKSPDAVFTATVNCVGLSGHIFHDANGMVDGIVNATGSSQFAANYLYAVLVDPTTNEVLDVKGITAGGAYDFGKVGQTAYEIYVSTTEPIVGTTFTTSNYPSGYLPTGENLGSGAGTDLLVDGKLNVTVGSSSVTQANFGLQMPPTTNNNTINNIPNPGGFNNYNTSTIPNSFFFGDADGNVDSITINQFPTGANYIKIGNDYYTTTGSTCPPQVITCLPWPGTITIPVVSGVPTKIISVDPIIEGNTTLVINFTVKDNANTESNNSDLTLNFVGDNNSALSGNVWNDANGNGLNDGMETLVSPTDLSTQLYAVLVQTNNTYSGDNTILNSVVVDPITGYSFSNVPEGNDYIIRIVSLTTAPIIGSDAASITQNLVETWRGVSTNADGIIVPNQDTENLEIVLNNLSTNKSNLNFGIEQAPVADDKIFIDVPRINFTVTPPAGYPSIPNFRTLPMSSPELTGGYTQKGSLTGSDPEDCTAAGSCNTGTSSTFMIASIKSNTRLVYDFGGITGIQELDLTGGPVSIPNFDTSKMKIYGAVGHGDVGDEYGFTYHLVDAAGIPSIEPAIYSIALKGGALSVSLVNFTATKQNSQSLLSWNTASENNNKGFGIERSIDGKKWSTLGFVNTKAVDGNSSSKLSYNYTGIKPENGTNFYRLKQVDFDGKFEYSEVRTLIFNEVLNTRIYPNPVKDELTVVGVTKGQTLVIYNNLGQEIKRMNVNENGSYKVNVASLVTAQYQLVILSDNELIETFKFVKD